MLINTKDIIRINIEIGEDGNLRNEGSLSYALSAIKEKPWLYELSYLIRCFLVDHCFQDGNKRTALAILILYFDEHNVEYDREKIMKIMRLIAKNNISDINKIMRMIKDGIYK
jgi:prophage maintenance system killer protein